MSEPKLTEAERNELRLIRDGMGDVLSQRVVDSYLRDGLIAVAHCMQCCGPCRFAHGHNAYDLTNAGRAALRGDK